jgi:alkylation response protein AidB-like acyl-CoA dehydrogenase
LLPRIAASASEIERGRRIPDALLEAMLDAGLFRLFLPRSMGGAEAHPLTFMDVLETIAGADASTAWNVGQNAVCAMVAASLPPEAARHIFGDRRAILAWGPPDPSARAVAADGGYRVTGSWSFASGGRHATWLGGYCPIHDPDGAPRTGAGGEPVWRLMLFPAESARYSDVWDVIGLRGTASDTFSVSELFVPQEHTVPKDDLSEVREPGWLYCFKTTNLYSCGFASVALGVARSLLDAFVRLAVEKSPRGFGGVLRDNGAIQMEVGQAEARWRAARSYLRQTMTEVCDSVPETRYLTMEQRMAIRLAATHAIQEALRVGDFAFEAAGASAIFASNAFERRFRDLRTIAQQVQGRKSHYQTVGKFLLGLEPDTLFA